MCCMSFWEAAPGQLHRQTEGATEGAVIQEKVDELRPGQVVLADQFVSKLLGRLSISHGRE